MRVMNKALKIAYLNHIGSPPWEFEPRRAAAGSQALIGRFETACIP